MIMSSYHYQFRPLGVINENTYNYNSTYINSNPENAVDFPPAKLFLQYSMDRTKSASLARGLTVLATDLLKKEGRKEGRNRFTSCPATPG